MTGKNDSRFIQSVASFDYVLSDLHWHLDKSSATPFSHFFGLPMVSKEPSRTKLNTDVPTPLSTIACIPILSSRRPKVRLMTGKRFLSLGRG